MKRTTLGVLTLTVCCTGCIQTKELSRQNMAFVEGGDFIMGSTNEVIDSLVDQYGFPKDFISSEFPPHEVTLSSFYIDKYEVTNADYKEFIDNNPLWQKENLPDSLDNGNYLKDWENNSYPVGEDSDPVVNVNWYAAMEYCSCKNKRLPTEAEWEYVARNRGELREYPWGNEQPDSTRANYLNLIGKAIEVGSYPPNELGVYDLAGNVWEFTLDGWSSDFYSKSPFSNPVNGQKYYDGVSFFKIKSRRVIRGGSWGGAEINLRTSFRDSHPPEGSGNHVGFRCVEELATSNNK
jgi:sulfatase modifying factor 1